MPAAHTVTPEPVTNSGRGWGEETGGWGEEGTGKWGAPKRVPLWPSADLPLHRLYGLRCGIWKRILAGGRGGLLKWSVSEAAPPPAAPLTSFLTSKMLLKYNTPSA